MTGKIRGVFLAIEADIGALSISCIVNAANEPLIMGGGVDGAIRRKAGPDMETELRRIGRCPAGEALLTAGHGLPAKYVIHTVAPIWDARAESREENMRLLANCYHNSRALARVTGKNVHAETRGRRRIHHEGHKEHEEKMMRLRRTITLCALRALCVEIICSAPPHEPITDRRENPRRDVTSTLPALASGRDGRGRCRAA